MPVYASGAFFRMIRCHNVPMPDQSVSGLAPSSNADRKDRAPVRPEKVHEAVFGGLRDGTLADFHPVSSAPCPSASPVSPYGQKAVGA